jgi:hypothetical protein
MKFFITLTLLFSASPGWTAPAYQGAFGFGGQRLENKKQTRWTLLDYLAQKQSIRLMDLWLSLNRPANIFEFYLGGGPVTYDYRSTEAGLTTTTSQRGSSYQAAIYVSIFGLEAEYEKTNHDLEAVSGALALRLLGTSNQGTNLTLKYGVRQLTDTSEDPERQWRNQFAEGSLTLYLFHFFGLQGNYRHYFRDSTKSSVELSGHRAGGGAFIDIFALRIYGNVFQETLERDDAGTVTTKERDGAEFGGRLFF